jgi:hypothetical protein
LAGPAGGDTCAGAPHELPRVGRADPKGLGDLQVRVFKTFPQYIGGPFRGWKAFDQQLDGGFGGTCVSIVGVPCQSV